MFDAIQHAMHLALRIVLTPETDLAVRGVRGFVADGPDGLVLLDEDVKRFRD